MNTRQHLKQIFGNYSLTGRYVKKYIVLFFICLVLMSLVETGMTIWQICRGFIGPKSWIYLGCYISLLVVCLSMIAFLVLVKKKDIPAHTVSHFGNFFSAFVLVWGAVISSVDAISGDFPIVYITVVVCVGGIVAANPIVFIVTSLAGGIAVSLVGQLYGPGGFLNTGDMINLSVFLLMSLVVALRTFYISSSEARAVDILHSLSRTDSMTGLENYNSYNDEIERLDRKCVGDRYLVYVFDVNCLKETNDLIGHRYGSEVIKKAAHVISDEFPDCKVYRIGGDEFAVIAESNIEEHQKRKGILRGRYSCREFEAEGKKLFLSLAIGCSIHEQGEEYVETFNRADLDMYENKKSIKTQINVKDVIVSNN